MRDLSELEQRFIEKAAAGEPLDCAPEGSTPDDFGAVRDWDQRLVAADLLTQLLTGARPLAGSARQGIRLRGALIAGKLDLSDVELVHPLVFEVCRFEEPVDIARAHVRRLVLTRCEVPGLVADELVSDRSLDFSNCRFGEPQRGAAAAGPGDRDAAIRLESAVVEGNVNLDGAILGSADASGNAMVADRLRVEGSVFMREGFEATGAIRLANAVIAGNLEMDGATLTGTDTSGVALQADGLRVSGAVFLRDGFEAAGAVRLLLSVIKASLEMGGATISGADSDGIALHADGLRVGGAVLLRDLRAVGSVRLVRATIKDHLSLRGAQLTGTDAHGSLVTDGSEVGGTVFLNDGFRAAGTVRIVSSRIGGQLALLPSGVDGEVALAGSRCSELLDLKASWPATGRLILRGLQFEALRYDTGWKQRRDWVRLQGFGKNWSPDPYEQLAKYYTGIGDKDAVRKVRIAKHDDELTHLKETSKGRLPYRVQRRLFAWMLGYGYRRYPATLLLVGMLLLAGMIFRVAESEGAMVPNEIQAAQGSSSSPCGEAYPCFNSFIYGADVVLPIIDFGQDSAWRPIETPGGGAWWIRSRWFLIAMGWALASVFVAAFTGLIQRD